jgi:hypothetical protein
MLPALFTSCLFRFESPRPIRFYPILVPECANGFTMSSKALFLRTNAPDAVSSGDSVRARPMFAYEPLDCSLDPNAIRLLRVLPGLSGGLIQVEMQQAAPGTVKPETASQSSEALDQNSIQGYRCLSYTWGEPCEGREILLNGCTFRVRDNLFEFLDVARRLFSTELLWVDAICIDQSSLAERGHQVERMGRVYECALGVLIWLGIFPSLEHIAAYLSRRRYVSRYAYFERKKIRDVMKHTYWTRAWVSIYLSNVFFHFQVNDPNP